MLPEIEKSRSDRPRAGFRDNCVETRIEIGPVMIGPRDLKLRDRIFKLDNVGDRFLDLGDPDTTRPACVQMPFPSPFVFWRKLAIHITQELILRRMLLLGLETIG